MAQSRQALRSRIKSVNSTKKITKAMEMIANAKLLKQRKKMEANREYAQRLQDTVNDIVANNQDVESKYLVHNKNTHTMTIIFCSDLGLCGGYNQNVFKLARETLDPADPVFLVGTAIHHQLKEAGFNIINEEQISSDKISFADLKKCVEDGVARYQAGEVGKVQILYTRFVNTMTFTPELDVLLPCTIKPGQKKEKVGEHQETLFEPDPASILDSLIPMMITDVTYSDWMESTTAEQGSRRVAMKAASDNADELSTTLKLEYNKARQAAITQEITVIVGGSSAV